MGRCVERLRAGPLEGDLERLIAAGSGQIAEGLTQVRRHSSCDGLVEGVRWMARLAQRVASAMLVWPVRRWAPMARLRRAAMTLGPDRVWAVEVSSR